MTDNDRQTPTSRNRPKLCYEILSDVAATTGRSVEDLPPLYDVVDPEALDRLFRHRVQEPIDGQVSFTYAGCRVVVDSDGSVIVSKRGQTTGHSSEPPDRWRYR